MRIPPGCRGTISARLLSRLAEAPQPSHQPTEHQPALRRQRNVSGHADEGAEGQAEHDEAKGWPGRCPSQRGSRMPRRLDGQERVREALAPEAPPVPVLLRRNDGLAVLAPPAGPPRHASEDKRWGTTPVAHLGTAEVPYPGSFARFARMTRFAFGPPDIRSRGRFCVDLDFQVWRGERGPGTRLAGRESRYWHPARRAGQDGRRH